MAQSRTPEQWAAWINDYIQDMVANSDLNTLHLPTAEKAWAAPLVGFCRGDDPVFVKIKSHIGDYYWSPAEFYQLAFPEEKAAASELTVISWVLPHTPRTMADNAQTTSYTSERWARTRKWGEEFNVKLRGSLAEKLMSEGVKAAAPMLHPDWHWVKGDRFIYSSNWSERHAAHAAGLGTFGLCDGLITPKGKAIRAGSVVAGLALPSTPRPYRTHREYCLFYAKGTCLKCIPRCPAGALSKKGHDKVKCQDYVQVKSANYVQETWGFEAYGCGLCQTNVPCADHIPGPEEG